MGKPVLNCPHRTCGINHIFFWGEITLRQCALLAFARWLWFEAMPAGLKAKEGMVVPADETNFTRAGQRGKVSFAFAWNKKRQQQ